MTKWIRRVLSVLLIPTALLLSGCLLNVFQTAKTLGEGNVALTIGSGLFDMSLIETESLYFLTPQARLAVGLADGIDLGAQTGLLVPFGEGEVVWPGATGDVKFALFDDPELFALSLAVGGGFSLETLGFDAFVTLFLDSNVRFLPLFVLYQPHVALAEGFALIQHFAGGLKLRLSDRVRLLVQADYNSYTYVSYGLAVEVEL
jgi:hypothetical protein